MGGHGDVPPQFSLLERSVRNSGDYLSWGEPRHSSGHLSWSHPDPLFVWSRNREAWPSSPIGNNSEGTFQLQSCLRSHQRSSVDLPHFSPAAPTPTSTGVDSSCIPWSTSVPSTLPIVHCPGNPTPNKALAPVSRGRARVHRHGMRNGKTIIIDMEEIKSYNISIGMKWTIF